MPIDASSERTFVALASFGQERLWFVDRLNPNQPTYNLPIAFRIYGKLDADALRRSCDELVRRHEVLRTSFSEADGQVRQVLRGPESADFKLADLSTIPAIDREAQAHRLSEQEANTPFDLGRDKLIRFRVFRLAPADHIFVLTMHHIASDDWSLGILLRELTILYQDFSNSRPASLAAPEIQYVDFAHWQRQWLQDSACEAHIQYWREILNAAPSGLHLPVSRTRSAIRTGRGSVKGWTLDATLSARLGTLSQEEGVTLFMLLLAAFKVLLFRYSAQSDLVVGMPVAGRNRTELEDMVGFFVNMIPFRTRPSADLTFREFLSAVREAAVSAYSHQDLPFERIVEAVRPNRDSNQSPIFQVTFQLIPAAERTPVLLGLDCVLLDLGCDTAKYDLSLCMVQSGAGLAMQWEYSNDLFDDDVIARMGVQFQTLLESLSSDPNGTLGRLPLLSEAERHKLIRAHNDTDAQFPTSVCVHELVEAQVEGWPDRIAVRSGDSVMTYRELNRRASALARRLGAQGVLPETRVGVFLPRSADLIVALLGVLKAGGAYVPLDPELPKQRLSHIIQDAKISAVVTRKALLSTLASLAVKLFCLVDDESYELEDPHVKDQHAFSRPWSHNLAYLIYTSGSTGSPKAVGIEHRNIVNFLFWARSTFSSDELAGVWAVRPISFDCSILEILVPLSCGGSVVIVDNPFEPGGTADESHITLMDIMPSEADHLLKFGKIPASVKTLTIGGEAVSARLVRDLYKQSAVDRVLVLYGNTETAYAVSSEVASRVGDSPVTLGRPISNVRLYVLDSHLEPVPVGIPGEIYIGGSGVGRGYLGRPRLTAERFLPDSLSKRPGCRLYKTGDRARYLPDGSIEFLGRVDTQVKLRGFRIELEEIEAVLRTHPRIRAAAVAVYTDRSGAQRLVAHVVGGADACIPPERELRSFLTNRLPRYMVPSAFILLDEIPLTSSGKVDRTSLRTPDPNIMGINEEPIPPRSPLEADLAEVWAEALGLETVSVNDNFFELGGDSMRAILVRARARERGMSFSIEQLFNNQTIEELAQALSKS